MDRPFRKILVANRGEIAVRILRSCRDLGIETVAIYSEADRNSLHVRYANEARLIGPPAPADSYLRIDRILEIAKETGAEAIHPGFGFLAENADFARAVTEAGFAFIGPPPESMEVMGDKLASRAAMVTAGVAVVPGTTDPLADADEARKVAEEVGYPVMLKASAGGGGKGIRVVRSADEIESAFNTASGESLSAFGDGRMYIEKFLERPRHVEVQVLGDQYGKVIHVGERECSIQRRHQKLIEEAPCTVVDDETRANMGAMAVAAAKAVDYVSAGTVEFLWSNGEYYFLEMNTRIQVEHAITEEVYGVDLIAWMIRIAAGEKLTLPDNMTPRGHAFEVRLNAEDPEQGFIPSLGTIQDLRLPGGPGVRVDSAMYRGMEVTPYYDSMLAKLITYGSSREQARRRMLRVLQELFVGGVKTSASLALQILQTPEFIAGDYDTGFLEAWRESNPETSREVEDDFEEVAALVAALHRHHSANQKALQFAGNADSTLSPWVAADRFKRLGKGARL